MVTASQLSDVEMENLVGSSEAAFSSRSASPRATWTVPLVPVRSENVWP
jgi:hypothetical protein